MKKKILTILTAGIMALSAAAAMTSCGTDYCSYGGCMAKATSGGRCSKHQGLENDPNYGLPDKWKTKSQKGM